MATNPTFGSLSNTAALRPEPHADQRTELLPGAESELVADGSQDNADPAIEAILAPDCYDDESAQAPGSGIGSVMAYLSPESSSGI